MDFFIPIILPRFFMINIIFNKYFEEIFLMTDKIYKDAMKCDNKLRNTEIISNRKFCIRKIMNNL